MNISGGGGTTSPGGSTTQVQYNNAGAFAGDAGLTFDSSTGKLTIGKQLVIASGAVTSDAPLLNLTQTWNAGAVTFTGLKFNATDTASASGSLLMDLQVGGTSKFKFHKNGALVVAASSGINSSGYIGCWTAGQIGFSNAANWTDSATLDTYLSRDAAGTMALRNSTSAQLFRIYATTDVSTTNYERGKIGWVGSTFLIGTEKGGTGSARGIEFQTDGLTCLTINSSGSFIIADAKNIAVGTGTGTKIASASTQKIAFYGATPIVRPTAVADATDAASAITQLNALLSRMRDLGLIAP